MVETISGHNDFDNIKPAQDAGSDEKDLWRQWAIKAQNGDKNAYGLLLREITPYIRNVIVPGLANPDWAEDITQEVLLSVHKSLHSFDSQCDFSPWLHAIINFRKTDFLRKHYRQQERKERAGNYGRAIGSHVTVPARAGELRDMERALDMLPEKQRRIFTLVKVEGYTAREAANHMDMSVSAVKVSVHRAAKALRKILGRQETEAER